MPDLHESARQDVKQKTANELQRVQGSLFDLVAMLRIAPLESHGAVFKTAEATVSDRYSVCVSGQILEDVFGAAKRRFRVYDPLLLAGRSEPIIESDRMLEFPQGAAELQLSLLKSLFEVVEKLAAKEPAERTYREEETLARGDPACPVWPQATRRNNAMDVWVMLQALRPGVQHGEEPDPGSEPFGIGRQF